MEDKPNSLNFPESSLQPFTFMGIPLASCQSPEAAQSVRNVALEQLWNPEWMFPCPSDLLDAHVVKYIVYT